MPIGRLTCLAILSGTVGPVWIALDEEIFDAERLPMRVLAAFSAPLVRLRRFCETIICSGGNQKVWCNFCPKARNESDDGQTNIAERG